MDPQVLLEVMVGLFLGVALDVSNFSNVSGVLERSFASDERSLTAPLISKSDSFADTVFLSSDGLNAELS